MDTTIAAPRPGIRRQAFTFGRHFVEMWLSMCVIGVPLTLLVLGAASSYAGPELRERSPELAILLIAFTLTLPMTAWMLFRGMGIRPTLVMAGAAYAIALVLIVAVASGLAGRGWLLISVGEFCGLSCIAMVGVMLANLDLYTGRAGHHAGHAV